MKLAEYVAQFLVERGVRHVFGMQGGAVLKLVDCFVNTGKIDYVHNFHEQASAFCADAYARIKGDVGVAIATSGPGATNLVTGIANAQLDSIPVLFITGQEFSHRIKSRDDIRSNGFQDLDIVSIANPITKYAVRLVDPRMIAYELGKAFYLAKSGRPGSVLIDIPIDLQFADVDPSALIQFVPPVSNDEGNNIGREIDAFFRLMESSKRPLILAGGGIRLAGAIQEFLAFIHLTEFPYVVTLNGLDVGGEAIGFAGLYGNPAPCLALANADLLIVLGSRLGQHQVGKTQKDYTRANIVHVDIDEEELGRCVDEVLSIKANLKEFLARVNARLNQNISLVCSDWKQKISVWKERYSDFQQRSDCNYEGVSPLALIRSCSSYLTPDAVITADVGQNQMWLAKAIELSAGQRLLNSSGLGSMGYSLPAAIASKIVSPNSQVVAFMGDGGLQVNLQELGVILLRNLNIKIFVIDNNALGLIKTSQDKYFDGRHIGSAAPFFGSPDLSKLAGAYGMSYRCISSDSDLSGLREIFEMDSACLTRVVVSSDYPLCTRFDYAAVFEVESDEFAS